MNKWMGSVVAVLLALSAYSVDFTVADQGTVVVTGEKKQMVLTSDTLCLMNANWKVVSDIFAAPMKLTREADGSVRCVWSADIGEATRTVRKVEDRVEIVWSMKFVNGVVMARHAGLTWLISAKAKTIGVEAPEAVAESRAMMIELPEERLLVEFSGSSIPWVFKELRRPDPEAPQKLVMSWNYDPAVVNVIESTVSVSSVNVK